MRYASYIGNVPRKSKFMYANGYIENCQRNAMVNSLETHEKNVFQHINVYIYYI